ncbi:MAG: hypothetical protein Q8R15_04405, partial [Candidatus Micrarchaeota archaeon]|nr:hypothetical protein [Candidatus Micrarchaeota archaeon]
PAEHVHDPALKEQSAAVLHDILAKHLLIRFSGTKVTEVVHSVGRDIPDNVERPFNLAHLRRIGINPDEDYPLHFYARMVSELAERIKYNQTKGN